jgi:hypothetical protein
LAQGRDRAVDFGQILRFHQHGNRYLAAVAASEHRIIVGCDRGVWQRGQCSR